MRVVALVKFYKLLILLVALVGAFAAGWVTGSSRKEVVYVRQEAKALKEWARTVASISKAVQAIADSTTRERVEIRYQTRTVVKEVTRYVESLPSEQVDKYELPEPVFALRLCAVDRLYEAAHAKLPADRQGVACPPALPDN